MEEKERPRYFLLDGHTPVPCDLMDWARLYETKTNRNVARDIIKNVLVSTVFLGLDHGFGQGDPILFETMAFDEESYNADSVLYENRYHTWDEAEAGHKFVVEVIKNEKEWPLHISDEDLGILVTRLLGR